MHTATHSRYYYTLRACYIGKGVFGVWGGCQR